MMKITKLFVFITICLGFCLGLLVVPVSTTWGVEYSQLPGLKDYKYLDADAFPWKPPYEPEMLYWQLYAYRRPEAWYNNCGINMWNHEGHIRQQLFRESTRAHYREYKERIPRSDPSKEVIKPGESAMDQILWWTYPPAIKGQAYLQIETYETPYKHTGGLRWLYSPNLKRTRRMGGGDRSDTIGGSDFTYDDILGRQVFEWFYKIIGVDYLYWEDLAWDQGSYAHFRSMLDLVTPPGPPMPYQKKTTQTVLSATGTEPCPAFVPTEDNPLICVVIEATPKIPDYYLSKLITWMVLPKSRLDFVNAFDVREEHFDPRGNMWRLRSRCWIFNTNPLQPDDMNPMHWYMWQHMEQVWDIQIDHRFRSWFMVTPIPYDLQDKYVPQNLFDPNGLPTISEDIHGAIAMTKKYDKAFQTILGADVKLIFGSKPRVMKDKFPGHRQIAESTLTKEWVQKVIAEEEAVKKAHPDRKHWVDWAHAPAEIKKLFVAQ